MNPSVVYCSVSGMGQRGPLTLVPGHDVNYQAWAGVLAPDGGPPVVPAVPLADLAGGMAAAFAVCAAVVRQLRTGEGEHIDVAMADVLATWTGAARAQAKNVDPETRGVPGYGTFETSDGLHIALGVLTEDHFWRSLCDVLGLTDCRDLGFGQRMTSLVELQSLIAGAIARRSRDELVADLIASDVPAAPVQDRSSDARDDALSRAIGRHRRARVRAVDGLSGAVRPAPGGAHRAGTRARPASGMRLSASPQVERRPSTVTAIEGVASPGARIDEPAAPPDGDCARRRGDMGRRALRRSSSRALLRGRDAVVNRGHHLIDRDAHRGERHVRPPSGRPAAPHRARSCVHPHPAPSARPANARGGSHGRSSACSGCSTSWR